LVAVEHIAVSLSETFNHFYSLLEFFILYSKNM